MSTKPPHRKSRTPRQRPRSELRNELRIIGGSWRGRRVRFTPLPELRPTPDRVRETLFNWLQPVIAGARCLDLYAGSGALGLEALSRGAARVVFVDRERAVIEQLRSTLSVLQSTSAELQVMQAKRYLESASPEAFDVVFLDPPFADETLRATCDALEDRGWLAADALIYVERPAREGAPNLPAHWSLRRSGRAGEVGYHLARRQAASGAAGETR